MKLILTLIGLCAIHSIASQTTYTLTNAENNCIMAVETMVVGPCGKVVHKNTVTLEPGDEIQVYRREMDELYIRHYLLESWGFRRDRDISTTHTYKRLNPERVIYSFDPRERVRLHLFTPSPKV